MAIHLQRDLENLQEELIALSSRVEAATQKAIRALSERDANLAQEVIDGDPENDRKDNRLEEECLKMLALHQPVAVDLRRIAAALKINTDLERIADLAENIAERVVHLVQFPPVSVPDKLRGMTDLTTTMVRQSLDAFANLDANQARLVCRLDDEVNRYNDDIIEEVIELMEQSPTMIRPGLSLFSAVRHLERIADHAKNIAEDVVYLVEGIIIHRQPTAVGAKT